MYKPIDWLTDQQCDDLVRFIRNKWVSPNYSTHLFQRVDTVEETSWYPTKTPIREIKYWHKLLLLSSTKQEEAIVQIADHLKNNLVSPKEVYRSLFTNVYVPWNNLVYSFVDYMIRNNDVNVVEMVNPRNPYYEANFQLMLLKEMEKQFHLIPKDLQNIIAEHSKTDYPYSKYKRNPIDQL